MIHEHKHTLIQFFRRNIAWGVLLALFVSVSGGVYAQNFVNTGTLSNTGTFRVKNGVSGLPDTVGGTFEYFGTTQQVQPTTYTILQLTTGTPSTKTTTGSFTVLQTIAVAKDVTYQLQSNSVLTLAPATGRITESGVIIGRVSKTVDLSLPADSTDFGGIGVALKYAGNSPGTTTVLRVSGTAPVANALRRSFTITPATPQRMNGSLTFTYNADEVPAGYDESRVELWRSVDGGTTWRRQRTTQSGVRQLQHTRWFIDGIWTAADSMLLIGPRNYEGDPDVILATQDSLRGRVNNLLEPFVAQFTDIFGNPVPSAKVKVSFAQTPLDASGYQLVDTLGVPLTDSTLYTDENGYVKIRVKLGTKKGYYRIRLQSDSLTTTEKILIGYADVGATMLASVSEPAGDTIRSVVAPLVIEAQDADHQAVPDVNIKFEIVSWPAGATAQAIIAADSVTNSSGRAQATVRLGEKVGNYRIKISSSDLDSIRYVDIYARHGRPVLAFQRTATSASDTIGSQLGSFVYAITDADTNAVPNRTIRLEFTEKPGGSTGDSLIVPSTATDANGEVRFNVRLGTKVGRYTVRAFDEGVAGSERLYTFTAMHGIPLQFAATSTLPADTIGTVIPALGGRISDRGDNPISNISLQFAFASVPTGAEGSVLSSNAVNTDSTGMASIRATLGNKPGMYRIRLASSVYPWLSYEWAFTIRPGVPVNLFADAGLNQEKEILQPLDSLFVVRVTDRALNPIANDTVFFTISTVPANARGAVLSQTTVLTDSSGHAAVRLQLGDKVGLYLVDAYSAHLQGVVQRFAARARNGSARYFAAERGNLQQQPILTVLDTALTVNVQDIGRNAVPGQPVRFIITRTPLNAYGYALGASALDTTVTTDSTGRAAVPLTVGSKVGTYEVAAVTTLPDTLYFTVRATVGAPHVLRQVAGNAQRGQIGDRLQPFVVRLLDKGENDIAGKQITFAIVDRPGVTKGDTLTTYTALTDSLGMASTQLTLGLRGGTYRVKASVGTLDTIFTAVALVVLADVNNDNYQNIGDVTAIIDHILGRKLLGEREFIKADVQPKYPDGTYGDGEVDIFDLVAIVDSIQAGKWNPLYNCLATPAESPQPSVLAKANDTKGTLATLNNVSSAFQITHIASRFTMENEIPIKGIQAVLYLNRPVTIDTVDFVFARAKMMNIQVKGDSTSLRILAYNMNNTPIEPDSGALFRLPVKLLSPSDIDSMHVLVSVDTNVAALVPYIAQDITAYIPSEWMLYQNYPNPFNPSTTIEFDVPEVAGKLPRVAIQIFNILGQKIRTLEPGVRDVGRYRVVWNGRDEANRRVASGVYFYRLLAGDYVSTKKMVLLK